MGRIVTAAAVSLDGYIAGPNETGFEHLFAWFDGGYHEVPTSNPDISIRLGEADHRFITAFWERCGAFVAGRRLFNLNDGWGGAHPLGWPTVVVTHHLPGDWIAAHPDSTITFKDDLPAAIERARAMAGDKDVVVAAGKLTNQCLELGLLDEITLNLVPVLLGDGVPLFEHLATAPILLDGPDPIVEGHRVTHLRYTVRRY